MTLVDVYFVVFKTITHCSNGRQHLRRRFRSAIQLLIFIWASCLGSWRCCWNPSSVCPCWKPQWSWALVQCQQHSSRGPSCNWTETPDHPKSPTMGLVRAVRWCVGSKRRTTTADGRRTHLRTTRINHPPECLCDMSIDLISRRGRCWGSALYYQCRLGLGSSEDRREQTAVTGFNQARYLGDEFLVV